VRIELPNCLASARVALRPLRPEDAAPHALAFREDPALGRLLGFEQDPDEEWLIDRIDRVARLAEEGTAAEFAIADPASDAFWGALTVHHFEWRHRRAEIGFWVIPAVRRRGVASGAISIAVSWLFDELSLLRVEMTTTPENLVVPALAGRVGFTHEGTLRARNIERGQRLDILYFGLLREEWAVEPRS
jgi:RimJ/RimL family protein N-acetyltransferase